MNKPKNKDIINQSKSITKNKKNTKKNGNKTEKKIVSEDNNNYQKQNSNEVEKNNFQFDKFCSLNNHQYNLDNSKPYKEETENDFDSRDSGNAMSKGCMSFDSYYNN